MEKMGQILEGSRPNTVHCRDDEGNSLELFAEPVLSDPILYLFGGGHVASQLVPLASRVGFKVVVIDDRPEFADPIRFPEAAEVSHHPFEGVMERLPVDESSYLVILTRGHTHDRIVLAQALKTQARYVKETTGQWATPLIPLCPVPASRQIGQRGSARYVMV